MVRLIDGGGGEDAAGGHKGRRGGECVWVSSLPSMATVLFGWWG